MTKKHLKFSLLFLLIFFVELLLVVDHQFTKLILGNFQYAVKPLITISLLVYLLKQTQLKGRFAKRISAGLIFGLIGDCLLMIISKNPLFFTLGLVAFLIGHLCYLSAFYVDFKSNTTVEKTTGFIAIGIFGLFCMGFYLLLRPHLGVMKVPVMIYAFVISIMAILATNRKSRVNTLSFRLIFIGVIFFLCSDSLLAYNKFVKNFQFAGVGIMATYMLAQFLITIGTIERKLKKRAKTEV